MRLCNRLLLFLTTLFFGVNAKALDVYYKAATFYAPATGPFVETYMTIAGNSAYFKKVKGGYQASVHIQLALIDADGNIAAGKKYNLTGPVFKDTNEVIPSFIDSQRYPVKNGTYTLELVITDNNAPAKTEPQKINQIIVLKYKKEVAVFSSVQLLESFNKSQTPSPLSKSGLDLIPYTVDYFPESVSKLSFYLEAYNLDTLLGSNKPFVFRYFIQNNDTKELMENFYSFRKSMAAAVNPLLGQIDISNLASGNYNLIIEVRDAQNELQMQKSLFFQRSAKVTPNYHVAFKPNSKLEKYFYNIQSADTLKIFVECLWPISDMLERERQINQAVKKDTALMRKYLVSYWTNMAADTADAMKLWMDYLKSVNEVAALFKCGKQKGYYTDRGRVYLQYGKPNQRTVQVSEENTFPYEIWQYYRIQDKSNGMFFTNKKFVFVNKNIADDCFMLVHSDMRGEILNERWRFEVMKRNTKGFENLDNETPGGSSNNQFDDLFSNPR